MDIQSVKVILTLGKTSPQKAPDFLMEVLENTVITWSDDGTAGFRLTFRAEKGSTYTTDFKILLKDLLAPFNRVVISVALNNSPTVLMDGVITHHDFAHGGGKETATLNISGQDLSVLMDLEDKIGYFENMNDAAIVKKILGTYSKYGISPTVKSPAKAWNAKSSYIPAMQDTTDLNYLKRLAQRHGFLFYLKPGPKANKSVAYWGPPERSAPKQDDPLNIYMGADTNVESVNFLYDPKSVFLSSGAVMKPKVKTSQFDKVSITKYSRTTALAKKDALKAHTQKRIRLFQRQGLDLNQATSIAQAFTDFSVDQAVTVKGELDVFRYGDMLRAPGRVELRGAGGTYSGLYYIKQVEHRLAFGEYKQAFTLTREGLGNTLA